MNRSLEEIIVDLIELFRPHAEGIDSVLDVGTGTSIPIHVFADHFPGIKYLTVDIIDIRKRKELPFALYDGKSLPYNDSEFDVSILNETLHHCESPEGVLREAHRVAKSVYVVEHFPNQGTNITDLINTEFEALENFDLDCKTYNPFTEDTLYKLFEKTGLILVHKFEIHYFGNRDIRKYFFKLV